MVRRYVPNEGDVVWLDFDPQSGHEQAGHRPAVVLSPVLYNKKTGLMLCCPITTQIKGFPWEVPIAGNPASVVLSDQVKSLDWRARNAKLKGNISPAELSTIRQYAIVLIGKP
jgi:mRNA interferase MazF